MISGRGLGLLLAALFPLTASAVPVTYVFSGSVDTAAAKAPDSPDVLPVPMIPFYTPFTGFFTYDDSAIPETPLPGYDLYRNSITAASISFGTDGALGTFMLGSGGITVADGPSLGPGFSDEVDVAFSLAPAANDPPFMSRSMNISGISFGTDVVSPGQGISDLPFDQFKQDGYLALSFGFTQLDAAGNELDYGSVGGQGQDFQISRVTSVPEPTTLSLWIVALLGIGTLVRRANRPAN